MDRDIPYIVFEAEMGRAERRHKRLIGIILVLIVAIVISNLAWLYAWMQYDYYGYEANSDRGNANIIGNAEKQAFLVWQVWQKAWHKSREPLVLSHPRIEWHSRGPGFDSP